MEEIRLRNEGRGFLTQQHGGPRLLGEEVDKSQRRLIGFTVGMIIKVLGGRVAECTRTEKRW